MKLNRVENTIVKVNSYLIFQDAKNEYEEEKINLFSKRECRCKINYVQLCDY